MSICFLLIKYTEENADGKSFFSHSSEDKEWYVNIVYKKLVKALGEDSVVIDNVVFQEGRKTIEEIYYQLGVTDLFVIFCLTKLWPHSGYKMN